MNYLKKAAALLAASSMLISGMTVSAYAEGSWNSDTVLPPAAASSSSEWKSAMTVAEDGEASGEGSGAPALGAGAICAEVNPSHDKIKTNEKFDLYFVTLIPVVNFNETVTKYDLPTSQISVVTRNNDSFKFVDNYSDSYRFWFDGAFLCVEAAYFNVVYLGKGNTLDYIVNYIGENNAAMNASLSVSIPSCVEAVEEKPDEPVVETPSFVLRSAKSFSVKAGTRTSLKFSFSSVGKGRITQVTASLSSSDPSITVEDMGEKTSSSLSPSFDFPINVSKTAPAGVYNLSLRLQVYDENGKPASAGDYNIPVTVTSSINSSGLSVDSYKVSKDTVKPGDKFSLTIGIRNNCGIDLKDVNVSLVLEDSKKFALDGGFSKQTVSISNGKSSTVTFGLVAGDEVRSTRETIGIRASYRIDPAKADTEQTFDTSVIINCKPKDTGSDNNKFALSMTNYSVNRTEIQDGTHFRLDMTFTNSGDTNINNARITLSGLDGLKFAVDKGLTYADFDIAAGKSKSFSFDLVGCAGIASIREVLTVRIEFGDISTESFVTVNCKPKKTENTPGENEVFAPNIIIESYDFGATYVTAGQTFPLNVTIKNVSSTALIENLKVTLNGASNSTDGSIAYSPANSANSFFFETLGMRASTNLSLDLLAKSDATPNSYPVMITFDYEYSYNGKHYKAASHSETITIPLQQEDRLSINDPEAPGYVINVGDMCNINVSIVNKGKSSAYNVSATVEGEGFIVETPTYYIGNVDSGKEEYYDAQIIPQQEGDITGTIIFTYEDANGMAKEQRKEFKFTAATMNYGMMGEDIFFDGGMPAPEPPKNNMTWLWFVIGGAVVLIVGIIITVVLVKKAKARKLQRELEEDDEDN